MVARQPLEVLDRGDLRLQRLVARDQLRQLRLASGREDGAHARDPQRRDARAALSGTPGGAGRQTFVQTPPFVLGEKRAIAEHRRDRVAAKLRDRRGVRGIDALAQRQRPPRGDQRQRERRQLLGRSRQIGAQHGHVIVFFAIEQRKRARVEGGNAAAREVVLDLGTHRFQRGRRGDGLVEAQEKYARVGLALLEPGVVLARLGEERVDERLVDPALPRAIRLRSDRRDDLIDQRARRIVVSRFADDHAVAVELRVGKQLGLVGEVGRRDHRRRRLAQVAQHLPGGADQHRALDSGVDDGCDRQLRQAAQQVVGPLEVRARQLHRRQQLADADAPVLVDVDQRRGSRVQIQARGRRRQRDPELLIERRQIYEVVARGQLDLVEAAGAEETPLVIGLGRHVVTGTSGSA